MMNNTLLCIFQPNLQHDLNPALLTFQSLEFRIYDLSLVQNITHHMHSKLFHATQCNTGKHKIETNAIFVLQHAYQHLMFTNQCNNITLRVLGA